MGSSHILIVVLAARMTLLDISPPRSEDFHAFTVLFTEEVKDFLGKLVQEFDKEVDDILRQRKLLKLRYDSDGNLPVFKPSMARSDTTWKIASLPKRLRKRHLDLGDVSPADTERFTECLRQDVDGIQTDFDDGHCPTWHNQIQGWYNIYRHVHGQLDGVPAMEAAPVLMLRPRAWNMTEHSILVDGKEAPGPLVDFGLLMYHNARLMHEAGSGPFFYLSKLEGSNEANLWNKIFVWAQEQLGLPIGTVKACVLIENVFASFEMEEILWELRDHSAGLNCGIWDYSASFINKFGHRTDFLLPDRSKYVSMDRPFLAAYMDLVVSTCFKRGAPATGGMAANILVDGNEQDIIEKVVNSKDKEIKAGVDGFMVYDLGLIKPIRQLWKKYDGCNFKTAKCNIKITANDLLHLPEGGVTLAGLEHNIRVGVLFICAWYSGKGCFVLKGCVEDSATAEISRSQVWQWIRQKARLEETGEVVTVKMVREMVEEFARGHVEETKEACEVFLEIVTMREFPEFITTLLNDSHEFRTRQSTQSQLY